MPSLPLATAFTDSAVTEAGFKSAITDQREFLAGLLGTTGNQIDALKAMGVPLNDTVAKTGAYTVIAADRGVTLLCSGTFTISLTAAATLGDGFTFAVVNTGTGVIKIDPNSTEQIDGASTKDIAAGSSAIVTTNGTAFYSVGGGGSVSGTLIGYQVFTASGTYTKATNNPSFVIVQVVGAGGAGGSSGSGTGFNGSGGGGGAGGYSIKRILASSLASSETVTVGSTSGASSSFGTHCSATGGSNGATGSNGAGGAGGIGSGGNINLRGGGGGSGVNINSSTGVGGNSVFGGGGRGVGSSSAGQAGATNTGGGGSGGATTQTNAQAGGAGGSGVVIVWEYA